ncbi:hillarin-like [Mizuhopecten yessoensis]|uniref:Kyphoscoliosis peptidase n=1 Tax=Mizuhopecten yessoensis TaxID=6573 RepID=A0A210Q3W6_MIZYE|nr:hillarin-like [Mizuhopecten yessoensis]OWF43434.1 Kyphoscoliosis peptidase [Mizuhopecten yessoensis]
MGCGQSVRVNLRTKKDDPKSKTIADPVIQYGTYQFNRNSIFVETHSLYVVDPSPLEFFPPPHVPPTSKSEIFNEEEYEHLDKRAMKVPNEKKKGTLIKLVKYLIKPCKDDVGKVRVLFTWLCAQNMDKMVVPMQPPKENSVVYYLTRLKVKKNNYAQMFSFLCRIINIPCICIHGYLKGSTYQIGQSVEKNKAALYGEWNAVLIDNTWRLINPYWAACAVGTEVSENVDRTFKVDETYFLPDPEQLVNSHFPEEPSWQLVDRPVSIHGFERKAFVKERFFELGMRLLTHSLCELQTDSGDIELTFGIPEHKKMDIQLNCLIFRADFNDWHLQEDSRFQHDMIYNPNDNSVAIRIRFPRKGTYKLEIVGKDRTIEEDGYDFDWVAVYKIRVNGFPKKYQAFPKVGDSGWGNNPRIEENGLAALSHPHAVILAEGDMTLIAFGIEEDSAKGLDLRYRLTDVNKSLDALPLEKTGVTEEEDQYIIEVRPPQGDEAALVVYILTEEGEQINICNNLIVGVDAASVNLAEDIANVKSQLQAAIDDLHLAALDRAVDLVNIKEYEEPMQREMNIARDLITRFTNLHVQKHDVLAIPNSTITEICSNPVLDEVHEVIKAMLLLLGDYEEITTIWTNAIEILSRKETQSLRNRINTFNILKLDMDITLGANKLISRLDLEKITTNCPAAGHMYMWVKGIVEENMKRRPDEVKKTIPRTHELGGPGAPIFKIKEIAGKVPISEI